MAHKPTYEELEPEVKELEKETAQRKRAEEELRISEEWYRTAIEHSNDGVALVKEGQHLYVNRKYIEMFGYERPEEMIGKPISMVVHPDDRKRVAEISRRRQKGSSAPSRYVIKGLRKDGEPISIEVSLTKTTHHEESVLLVYMRDITKRDKTEEALHRSVEEWRHSFDALDEMMFLIDTDFIIQRANQATARTLGMHLDQILGQPCYRLIHGTETPPDYCPHLQVRNTGVPQDVEIEEAHLGCILHISASPVKDKQGRVVRTIEIINDVTTRRHHEREALRLNEALAESFKGITEGLSDLVESRDPYTAGHSKGLAELATNIAGKMGMNKEEIQGLWICALLHDIGKAVIPSGILNKPGRLSEHEWGIIRQHPKTAHEVLRRIPFPWPVAEVVYQHHERLDGSGYPRGLKGDDIHSWARILAVADVVDAMGNHRPYRPAFRLQDVLDEVNRGNGNLFDKRIVNICASLLSEEDKRVLVAEDDPAVLQLLGEFLHRLGWEAEGFEDPRLALQAFEKRPFPVVITDLNMPGMDGLELLRKVREIQPASKVVVITGYPGKEETVQALRLGACDFLEKPLDLQAVKATVANSMRLYKREKG